MVSEAQVRTGLVAFFQAVDTTMRGYDQVQVPAENREEEINDLFRDDTKNLNFFTVRRASFDEEQTELGRARTANDEYEIKFIKSRRQDGGTANAFDLFLESCRSAVRASRDLGLGPTVSHGPLRTATDMPELGLFANRTVHVALCRMTIRRAISAGA